MLTANSRSLQRHRVFFVPPAHHNATLHSIMWNITDIESRELSGIRKSASKTSAGIKSVVPNPPLFPGMRLYNQLSGPSRK